MKKQWKKKVLVSMVMLCLLSTALFSAGVFAQGEEWKGKGLGGFKLHADRDESHGSDSHGDSGHEEEGATSDTGSGATVHPDESQELATDDQDEHGDDHGGSKDGDKGHWGGGTSEHGSDDHGKPDEHEPGEEEEEEAPDPFDESIPDTELVDEGKFVTLTVNVHDLEDGDIAKICVYKLDEGVFTYKKTVSVTGAGNKSVGAFEADVPVGHQCFVEGYPVSGYEVPKKEIVSLGTFKGKFEETVNIYYGDKNSIMISNFSITNKPDRSMLVGKNIQLETRVEPLNASYTSIKWSVEGAAVEVNQSGMVTANETGSAIVTAELKNDETVLRTDSCTISVVEITELEDISARFSDPIPLGERIKLPTTIEAKDNEGDFHEVSIDWAGEFVQSLNDGKYLYVTGVCDCDKGTLCSECKVELTGYPDIPGYAFILVPLKVQHGRLQTIRWDMENVPDRLVITEGVPYVFEVQINQAAAGNDFENTDWDGAYWVSLDPDIVSVSLPAKRVVSYNYQPGDMIDEAVVSTSIKGLSANHPAVVSMKDSGNNLLMEINISVVSDPEALVDDAYIIATTELFGEQANEQFSSFNEVFITGKAIPEATYNIRVSEKGVDGILGEGSIAISAVDETVYHQNEIPVVDQLGKVISGFQLSDAVSSFGTITTNSKEVFIEMSTDPDFPEGDDETTGLPTTFKTNMKIGSPVPTGSIDVVLTDWYGNPLPEEFLYNHVILAREEYGDLTLEEVGIEVFYQEGVDPDDVELGLRIPENDERLTVPYGDIYADGVKQFGFILRRTNLQGKEETYVEWTVPREVLKIGGYLLLMDDEGLFTSLENVTDDGMEKQIHILRDDELPMKVKVRIPDDWTE